MKIKKVFEGLGPKQRKAVEKNQSIIQKRRKKEEKKDVPRAKRNEILKTQKVLSKRVFDPMIYKKSETVELV